MGVILSHGCTPFVSNLSLLMIGLTGQLASFIFNV